MKRGLAAVFCSGAAVMLVELLAGRLVAPFFGQSTRTWAALTGVTLAGVTLGNALGGRLSARVRPGRVAAWALAAGGTLAGALPWTLPLFFFPGEGTILRLLVFVTAGFFPPALALGCVSPAVAAACVRVRRNGADLGALYGASMAGSVLGSVCGGLWLPFAFPSDTVYLAAGGILLLTAISARRLSGAEDEPAATTAETAAETAAGRVVGRGAVAAQLLVLFLIGWMSMGAELAGIRQVTPSLGGSHIVWSLFYVTFIGWMGLGGWIGGRAADRGGAGPLTATLFTGLGVVLLCTLAVQGSFFRGSVLAFPIPLRMFLQIVLAFAPLAFLLGALSAVALKAATASPLREGRRGWIGLCYAVLSAGSVAGTFCTGLWLVGRIHSGVQYVVYALLCASCALAVDGRRAIRERSFRAVGAAGLLAFTLLVLGCAAVRKDHLLPSSLFPVSMPTEIAVVEGNEIQFYRESVYNVVTVTKNGEMRTVYLDRTPHTTINRLRPGELLASYTRLLDVAVKDCCPAAGAGGRRLLMIGGGGYALPRVWRSEKDWGLVRVVEIDPVVTEAAVREMDAAPTVKFLEYIAEDGRAAVDGMLRKGEEKTFDVVIGDTISDISIPYHLVTREFNRRIARLLRPGGRYLVHVLDRLDDPRLLGSVIKTLRDDFPSVQAYTYAGVRDMRQSFVIIAGATPVEGNKLLRDLSARYPDARPVFLGQEDAQRLAARPEAVRFTDRFSPVEKFVWRVLTRDVQYRPYRLAEEAAERRRAGDRAGAYRLAEEALALQPEQPVALRILADAAESGERAEQALKLLRGQAERPSALPNAKEIYAGLLCMRGDYAAALPILDDLHRHWPENMSFLRSWLNTRLRLGDAKGVRLWLEKDPAAETLPDEWRHSLLKQTQEPTPR